MDRAWSFEEFIEAVMLYFTDCSPRAERSVYVRHDRESGRYFARLSSGETIIGRPGSFKVTMRYPNHQLMFELQGNKEGCDPAWEQKISATA